MDQKEEDKSEESLQKHLIFYQKLNHKISKMKNESQNSTNEKILKHLDERIDALELDKKRIRQLFPDTEDEIWNEPYQK